MPISTIPRPQKRKKAYSDTFKSQTVALADILQNGEQAGQIMGVSKSNVSLWRRHPDLQPGLEKAIVERNLVEALDHMAWRIVDTMPDKMEDASLSQLAHALSVTIDKAQLLRGNPTSISQSQTLTRDQAIDRIRQAIQQNAITIEPDKVELLPTHTEEGRGGGTQDWDSGQGNDREGTDVDQFVGTDLGYLPEDDVGVT